MLAPFYRPLQELSTQRGGEAQGDTGGTVFTNTQPLWSLSQDVQNDDEDVGKLAVVCCLTVLSKHF